MTSTTIVCYLFLATSLLFVGGSSVSKLPEDTNNVVQDDEFNHTNEEWKKYIDSNEPKSQNQVVRKFPETTLLSAFIGPRNLQSLKNTKKEVISFLPDGPKIQGNCNSNSKQNFFVSPRTRNGEYLQAWHNPQYWGSNPFLLPKRSFRNADNDLFNLKMYSWGPNPIFMGSIPQSKQKEDTELTGSNSHEQFNPNYSNSIWQSNPRFWGKKNYWLSRGRREEKGTDIQEDSALDKQAEDITQSNSLPSYDILPLEVSPWLNTRDRRWNMNDAMSQYTGTDFWRSRGRRQSQADNNLKVKENIQMPFWSPRGKKSEENKMELWTYVEPNEEQSLSESHAPLNGQIDSKLRLLRMLTGELQPNQETFIRKQRDRFNGHSRQVRDSTRIVLNTPNGFLIPRG